MGKGGVGDDDDDGVTGDFHTLPTIGCWGICTC